MTHESITSNIVGLWNKMGQVSESVHKVSECVQELATIIRQGAPQPMGQPGTTCCHQCSGSTMPSARSTQPSQPSSSSGTPGAIVVPPWPQPLHPGGPTSSVRDPRPVPAIVVPGTTTATSCTSASTAGQPVNSPLHTHRSTAAAGWACHSKPAAQAVRRHQASQTQFLVGHCRPLACWRSRTWP